MGIVKYKGETVLTGPVASVSATSSWNNSMGQYDNPRLIVSFFEPGAYQPSELSIGVSDDQPAGTLQAHVAFDADIDQVEALKAYNARLDAERIERLDAEERATIRRGKDVRVIKGRKIPIGTEARVFWLGQTKYGVSVGLELADGRRLFTAIANLEVIQ
jgi:hypothetical protein